MPKLPFYEKPQYPVFKISKTADVHMMEIIDFLKWTLDNDQLEIATYLPEMDDASFFLVAATGLGKTVGVPIHVLIRQIQRAGAKPNPAPRVWVVEPRIPIAVEQAEYMNHLWNEYRMKRSRSHKLTAPLFGCVTSASGRINPEAPVQFVTTGIFELLSNEGKLDPVSDRVIIDEAHVTVEQNAGVEVGIALGRKAGVTIDYMSATVDVTGLEASIGVSKIIRADKARNIIWKSNLLQPIDKIIIPLVKDTLVSPNVGGQFFPKSDFRDVAKVTASVLEHGRSHGMLVVVNSFNGDASDTRKLTNKLNKHIPEIPVLHLAGDVVRDPRKQQTFKTRLAEIESLHQNYVIISTSVVEMGITFPTLDYVVTMDSGYDQETVGDVTFPVVAPLGVNSLLQRIGRVGRRRPGIAYISNEVDAEYASLEDVHLNGRALAYEPIRYPLTSAPLMSLAYQALNQSEGSAEKWLRELGLPSRIHENEERMEYFREQITRLHDLGLAEDNRLTDLGVFMRQWIGRADISYVTQLQRRFMEGASYEELLFWVVSTALSSTPLSTLRASHGYFVDPNGKHTEVANRINLWSDSINEDMALFQAIVGISQVAPRYFWDSRDSSELGILTLSKWCNWSGLDGRKFLKTAKAVRDIFDLFEKINGESESYKTVFGKRFSKRLATVDWQGALGALSERWMIEELSQLNGVSTIQVHYNEELDAFTWHDSDHGYNGVISQDDTPVILKHGANYIARVQPSRLDKKSRMAWRLSSLSVIFESTPLIETVTPASVVYEDSPRRTAGFFARLFGRE